MTDQPLDYTDTAQPEEIAGMVLFLCSDAASFTTGSLHLVDGGHTAH